MLTYFQIILFFIFFGGSILLFGFPIKSYYLIIDHILSKIIMMKIYIQHLYKKIHDRYFAHKGFSINNIVMYDDDHNNIAVFGDQIDFPEMNRAIFESLMYRGFHTYANTNLSECDNVYIKISYRYDEKDYVFVYTNEMAQKDLRVPLPLYDERRMEMFKNDIFEPHYRTHSKDASLYSLFHVDCKHIKSVKYNGVEDARLLDRVNKYKGVMNDFGLMYQSRIQLKHILRNGEIANLQSMEIEYEAPYFDDITFDIIPHVIKLTHKDDYVISERIKGVLERRDHFETQK